MPLGLPVRFLSAHADKALNERLASLAEEADLSRVFNPSVLQFADTTYVAFRAESHPEARPFSAYLASFRPDGVRQLVDLSELYRGIGIPRVSDPKLYAAAEGVRLTFNTGFSGDVENKIFVVDATNGLGSPIECRLADRSRVEKNWCFYSENGELRAIYSLDPFILLRSRRASEGVIDFEKVRSSRGVGRHDLSLGSQLLADGDGGGYLIAHEKIRVGRRRAYLGRLVRVSGLAAARPHVEVSRRRLVHDAGFIRPAADRVNPNLWSASYFAGLAGSASSPLLSYGIDDRSFGFARTEPLEALM